MKLHVTVSKMGGGYLKATFGQTWNETRNCWEIDSVFGADEEELLHRLKTRIPSIRNNLRMLRNVATKKGVYGKPYTP